MEPDDAAPSDDRRLSATAELDRLRVLCRRQAHAIEVLGARASTLREGAAALTAENAELRAACDEFRAQRGAGARANGSDARGPARETSFPLDARAPGAARTFVESLDGRIATSLLGDALLVVSELVTNSVRHSGAAAGGVILRVHLADMTVRLEVEDRGRGPLIAPRGPTLDGHGGFGLNIIHAISERWGLERVATGGTRVWAQLAGAPRAGGDP